MSTEDSGAETRERRSPWPVILLHASTVGILFTWSGVVPPKELHNDFFAVGISLFMVLGATGLASLLWHSLRKNIRRTVGKALSVGVAWFFTAAYFIGAFSSVYWIVSIRDPDAFTEALTHDDAIYFALATFTTTGFGDIAPVSGIARLTVSAQMVVGFVLVAVALVLALSRWSPARDDTDPPGNQTGNTPT